MVWKIRSKTAYTFDRGLLRYNTGKFKILALNNINELPAIQVKTDRYSPTRVTHNYRNISRACKQFLLGDPLAEQLMITMLRVEFLWPIRNIKSPIENYKPIVYTLNLSKEYLLIILIDIILLLVKITILYNYLCMKR